MDVQLTFDLFLILFFTGLGAGFVDSIAGGGGLIALPVLLSIGIPPQMALGTNKLQGTFGTLSASFNFIRKGEVRLSDVGTGIFFTFIGAAAGTWIVQSLDASFLKHLVPVLLLGVFFYTLFSKGMGDREREPKMEQSAFFTLFGLALGFYDGFFGPGTGSFWMAGLCGLLGFSITRSAGTTRVMNFTSNIVSLAVFIIGGNVIFSLGLCMAGGQLIGANLGSTMAIRKGAGFIRPVFMAVVAVTVVRLVYVSWQ